MGYKKQGDTILWVILIVICVMGISDYSKADNLVLGEYTHHFNRYTNGPCATGYTRQELDALGNQNLNVCERFKVTQPLIGYEHNGWVTSAFNNSFNHFSFSVVRNFEYELNPYVKTLFAIGVSTGYTKNEPSLGLLTGIVYAGFDIHPKNDKVGAVLVCNSLFCGIGMRVKL